MANFDDFLTELKNNLLSLLKDELGAYKDQVLEDGSAFAIKAKDDLQRWFSEMHEGRLSKNDFEFLVKGKSDLAEMEALKLAGLAQVRLDKLKAGIIETVIGTAEKIFL